MLSAVVVAVGTAISAFWILSANSWMQTPAGHEMRDGIAYPVDWLADHLQSELPLSLRAHDDRRLSDDRRSSCWRSARATWSPAVIASDGRTMMRMGLGMVAVLAPLQLFIGDQHGLNTLKHQPIKIAAIEAHWDGSKPGDSCCSRGRTRRRRRTALR